MAATRGVKIQCSDGGGDRAKGHRSLRKSIVSLMAAVSGIFD